MKKLISIILAVMLVSALAVTSFAAPTIDYVFNADGNTYIFGTVDNTVSDMGLEFSDKDGKTHTALFSELGASEIAEINYSYKYGYEIVANGKLGESFAAKPFYKVGEDTVNGVVYTVNPEEKTVETVAPGSVVAEFQETFSETSGSNLTSTLPSINGSSRNMFLRFDISNVNVNASEIIFTFGSFYANNQSYGYVSPDADIQLSIYAAEGASENCAAGCNLQTFMNNPANYTHAGVINKIKESGLDLSKVDVVLSAETKGITLAYQVAEHIGCEMVILRKEQKIYYKDVTRAQVDTYTTKGSHYLYLENGQIPKLAGKNVLIVDDVVSTGSSLSAIEEIVNKVDGNIYGKAFVFAEGDAAKRDDVIFVDALPLL